MEEEPQISQISQINAIGEICEICGSSLFIEIPIHLYRDRIFKLTNKDPLYCNKCNVEMELFYFCYD